MKIIRFILIAVLIVLCLSACDQSSGSGKESELWGVTIDDNGEGEWTFYKHNETIYGEGNWVYDWDGTDATCPYTFDEVVVSGNSISFTANGSATYPAPDVPPPYQCSDFTLDVQGSINYDTKTATGTYTISFNESSWPVISDGTWSAQLFSGGGILITEEVSDSAGGE